MNTENWPTEHWQALEGGKVVCLQCPRHCRIREGHRGVCYVRGNHLGKVVLHSYGRSSGFCIDPIEKKPLNHFLPGSSVLSFGTAGCNLACKFCQNWDISKSRQMDTLANEALPEELAKTAKLHNCQSVAFTYNDPVVFMEYAVDTALACKEYGIHSVAVTAGYVKERPREQLFAAIDAANIDLKAFSQKFYKKLCGGELEVVLDTLKYLKQETKVWFEVTTLLIPGENDSDEEINKLSQWFIENLGPDVPLHFSAFHPDFKMLDLPPTPAETLLRAREIALKNELRFVYVGNVHDALASSSYCPSCGERVMERDWYQLGQWSLDELGRCNNCSYQMPGVFKGKAGDWGRKRVRVQILS